jgi:hypothetical protein
MKRQSLALAATVQAAPALPLAQQQPPIARLINGLGVLALLLVAGLCLVAFVIVLATLLPQASQRSKTALLQTPWRAFFIGLANYLFLGGISLALFSTKIEFLGLVGVVILAFLATVTMIGLSGLVLIVGERLASLHNQEMSPLRQLVWGIIVLELAGLFPFVGWFLLTPVLLMISFGAGVLAWRNRKQLAIDNE